MILLQEIWPVRNRKQALGNYGYPYFAKGDQEHEEINGFLMLFVGILFGDKLDTGLKILSRYPLENVKRHTYSANGYLLNVFDDGEYAASKSVTSADLHHPGGKVLLGNTHIISSHPHENYYKQRKIQLREMADFVKKSWYGTYEGVVIGGDFNFGVEAVLQMTSVVQLSRI